MLDLELMSILLPALAAGILVLSTHIVLGKQVLKRGIIFIDLAIAQVAALGAIVAHMDHRLEDMPFSNVWMPALFALAGAGFIAAMLLLANDPHGAELLKQLMSGQILWVSWSQLVLPTVVYAGVLALIFWRPQILNGAGFYLLFALVITLSVELVGVYLVFSTLILPALALNKYQGKNGLFYAYLVGLMGYLLGLVLSATMDLPSGAAIVATLAVSALVFRVGLSKMATVSQI